MNTTSMQIVRSSRTGYGKPAATNPTSWPIDSTSTNTTPIITSAMRPRDGCGTTVPAGGVNQNSRPVSCCQAAVQAAMTLTLAHAYMAEYARLLAAGKASEEALAAILEVRLDMGASGQLMARLMFSAPDEI